MSLPPFYSAASHRMPAGFWLASMWAVQERWWLPWQASLPFGNILTMFLMVENSSFFFFWNQLCLFDDSFGCHVLPERMSLYCQHLWEKSLLISTVQDRHTLCGLSTCGINEISLKILVAAPTRDRPACGRGRRAFAATEPTACGRFERRWQREPERCPGIYCPCGRAAVWPPV